ncbi:MAG: DUF1501 domain-containing protein [Planctomycetaceae bacterium]
MPASSCDHPRCSRRTAVRAGAAGLLGLGASQLTVSQAVDAAAAGRITPRRSVIYLFLSGGLGQHDSFDLKPNAPAEIRGEFQPIATRTPGTFICEHLPRLAARSEHWSLVRSLTHPHNEHSDGHMVMLSGRSHLPPTFSRNEPRPTDWPSIAAIVSDQLLGRNNLPPAVVLPERLVHRTGRTIPGQFAGQLGATRDPWLIESSPFNPTTYGAYPEFEFHHARGAEHNTNLKFEAPSLTLPLEIAGDRFDRRLEVLAALESQRQMPGGKTLAGRFDRHRDSAVSLLTAPAIRDAFDVTRADAATQDRYGRHAFGWSLLMARRLVEAGVSLVQVNLGNNETWDTHGNAFPNLRNFLLPPLDQSLSALLDDLSSSGQLDETLLVMAGEFGRTPKITHLAQHYDAAGRDHWGGLQSVWLAGGGVAGGRVIGSSDKLGAYPATDPQLPENLAATIYDALGIPRDAMFHDPQGRPHAVYHGDAIPGLT